ncbi:hypothetical protein HMPREF1092_00630 [Clostridium thermobutyricum]|uniref:Uncharacterized protein n=1 Tax=Clostridium thermobutyricum TaxID=29372 RepID=N9XUQ2_9CLOT|nr:hypothetical protein HMPREF1092_00630 [Clostridium thermobutyricum]
MSTSLFILGIVAWFIAYLGLPALILIKKDL